MSDLTQGDRRARHALDSRAIESRALFGAFYLVFLVRAAFKRLLPHGSGSRDTIFAEARSAAGVMVASSFMGL